MSQEGLMATEHARELCLDMTARKLFCHGYPYGEGAGVPRGNKTSKLLTNRYVDSIIQVKGT